MGVLITTYKQHRIEYDEHKAEFVAINEAGEEVAKGPTQRKCEEALDTVLKLAFKPIAVLRFYQDRFEEGRITSFNLQDNSAWFSEKKPNGKFDREKVHLHWEKNFFKDNKHNRAVQVDIMNHIEAIKAHSEAIRTETKKFIDPITIGALMRRGGKDDATTK
jgi:hypothetical protein